MSPEERPTRPAEKKGYEGPPKNPKPAPTQPKPGKSKSVAASRKSRFLSALRTHVTRGRVSPLLAADAVAVAIKG